MHTSAQTELNLKIVSLNLLAFAALIEKFLMFANQCSAIIIIITLMTL